MEVDLVARVVALALPGVGADQVSWIERRANGAFPAVVGQTIAPGREYHHGGAAQLAEPRVQLKIIGIAMEDVVAVADALVAGLEPPATVGATKFGHAFLNGTVDLPAETIDGGTHVFGRVLDFHIFVEPAT